VASRHDIGAHAGRIFDTFEVMKQALLGVGSFFALSAHFGCSSSAFTTNPSADDACTQEAAARCARTAACDVDAIQVRFGDAATCQAQQKAACLNMLSASSTAASPSAVIACANALPSVACSDYNENFQPTSCQAPVGKLAAGAVCAFNGQCRSQFCGIGKNANCGVCMALPSVNDSCADLASCGPGLECVNKGTVCVSEVTKTGDMCDADIPCAAGFSCVGSKAATATAAATEGTCQPAVSSAGAACDPKRRTSAGCDATQGLACDPTSMTCIAILIAAAGAPCDNNLTLCSSAATCVIPAGATAGTCVAPAADGAACDTANGPNCMSLSRCVVTGTGTAGTCVLPVDSCGASTPSSGGASGTGGAGDGGSGLLGLGGIAPI
jgi:hypothetical protein